MNKKGYIKNCPFKKMKVKADEFHLLHGYFYGFCYLIVLSVTGKGYS